MDLQGTFDTVVGHLMLQYKRAVHEEEGKGPKLMYRTPSGLRDSIGCLIPDRLYKPEMEGYAFKGPSTWKQWANNDGLIHLKSALIYNGVDVENENALRMLTDLQRVHDNHEPEFWFDRLIATARTWRLSSLAVEHYAAQFQRGRGYREGR